MKVFVLVAVADSNVAVVVAGVVAGVVVVANALYNLTKFFDF